MGNIWGKLDEDAVLPTYKVTPEMIELCLKESERKAKLCPYYWLCWFLPTIFSLLTAAAIVEAYFLWKEKNRRAMLTLASQKFDPTDIGSSSLGRRSVGDTGWRRLSNGPKSGDIPSLEGGKKYPRNSIPLSKGGRRSITPADYETKRKRLTGSVDMTGKKFLPPVGVPFRRSFDTQNHEGDTDYKKNRLGGKDQKMKNKNVNDWKNRAKGQVDWKQKLKAGQSIRFSDIIDDRRHSKDLEADLDWNVKGGTDNKGGYNRRQSVNERMRQRGLPPPSTPPPQSFFGHMKSMFNKDTGKNFQSQKAPRSIAHFEKMKKDQPGQLVRGEKIVGDIDDIEVTSEDTEQGKRKNEFFDV
ncbi:hypothetical protein SNEBB_001943 [Seison nebaliae]|nr:hypothetical protein SNEBB_001943 [Seison nebaliae]